MADTLQALATAYNADPVVEPPPNVVVDDPDDRETPQGLFDELHALHQFTIDVAATAANAKCPRYFDKAVNGLSRDWGGESVWCNPPYSDLWAWVEKAHWEMRHEMGRVRPKVIVMLVPASRTDQVGWHRTVEPYRDREGTMLTTRFLKGRRRFISASGRNEKNPKNGSVLLIWWGEGGR